MTRQLLYNTILLLTGFIGYSQESNTDSLLNNIRSIPTKYLNTIDKKASQYTYRITTRTEKTLVKLSRWENKIQGVLQKINPEAANSLFGNNQITFTTLLEKLRQGEGVALQYRAPYYKYRDDVTTSLNYIAEQKEKLDSGMIKIATAASIKMKTLSDEEDKTEAIQQFIKERKKQLIEQAFQYIGRSKYFTKINKEAYYYTETLKNYRELFADSKKSEETAMTILKRIPAFQKFVQKNSMLASLFGQSGESGTMANIAGLQTRTSVQNLIQDRIASGGPNAQEAFRQNIQQAQGELTKLKEKLLNSVSEVGGSSGGQLPDFKPNMEKTKTFKQRFEYGFNLQFAKNNSLMPTTSDIALSIGYKINDKSVVGAGASYKLGMGSLQRIRFTHEGIGLRSFIDWKLKKQFFISGGYELNHNAQFTKIEQLKKYDVWQRSALLGITKKMKINTKWFRETNVQLLYDFFSQQHLPVSQPVLFRIGYLL